MLPMQVSYWTMKENQRHNKVSEAQAERTLQETERSNKAKEGETSRHNLASEAETYRSNKTRELETARSNLAVETETKRRNLAVEQISRDTLAETTRHNVATENFNVISLQETRRHNTATEAISSSQVAELSRHNRASEEQAATTAYNNYVVDTWKLAETKSYHQQQIQSNEEIADKRNTNTLIAAGIGAGATVVKGITDSLSKSVSSYISAQSGATTFY